MRYALGMLLLLVLSLAACTQPDPNQPQPPDQRMEISLMILRMADRMPAMQKVTPAGIFLAHNGVLAKFDSAAGYFRKAIDLFGPLPEWPAQLPSGDQGYAVLIERARRMAVPVFETAGDDLLVVIGGTYFRINAETLEVKAMAQVVEPDPLLEMVKSLRQPQGMGLAANPMAAFAVAQLSVKEGTLNIVTAQGRVVGVEIASGKVLYNQPAPEILSQRLFPPAKDGPFAEHPEPAAPAENAQFATVGQLEVQQSGAVKLIVVREASGARYVLSGQLADALLAAPPAAQQRVLLMGAYHKAVPWLPAAIKDTAKGTIELTAQVPLTIKPTIINLPERQ